MLNIENMDWKESQDMPDIPLHRHEAFCQEIAHLNEQSIDLKLETPYQLKESGNSVIVRFDKITFGTSTTRSEHKSIIPFLEWETNRYGYSTQTMQ